MPTGPCTFRPAFERVRSRKLPCGLATPVGRKSPHFLSPATYVLSQHLVPQALPLQRDSFSRCFAWVRIELAVVAFVLERDHAPRVPYRATSSTSSRAGSFIALSPIRSTTLSSSHLPRSLRRTNTDQTSHSLIPIGDTTAESRMVETVNDFIFCLAL